MLKATFGEEANVRAWYTNVAARIAAAAGDDAVQELVIAIARDVDPYAFGIFLEDPRVHELVLRHRFAHGPLREAPIAVHPEQGMVGFVFRHGVPLVVHDVERDPRYLRGPLANAKSALAVPIHSKGKTIGALDIESDNAWAFDDVDIRAITALADALGTAMGSRSTHRPTSEPVNTRAARGVTKVL